MRHCCLFLVSLPNTWYTLLSGLLPQQLLIMADSELVLHVWPAGWDLQSVNAECLAAIVYAQLAVPGEFVVEECTDPDLSPNGMCR